MLRGTEPSSRIVVWTDLTAKTITLVGLGFENWVGHFLMGRIMRGKCVVDASTGKDYDQDAWVLCLPVAESLCRCDRYIEHLSRGPLKLSILSIQSTCTR